MSAAIPPFFAAVSVWRRGRYGGLFWALFGAGAAGMFAAQIPKSMVASSLLPLLGVSLSVSTDELMRNSGVVLIGAVLAGFFEEPFKFFGLLVFRKRVDTASDGMCYGLGAGFGAGILEAMLLGVSAYFAVTSQQDVVPVDLNLLLGPTERVSASFLHAGLTAMFAYLYFSGKPLLGFLVSAGYHTFVDFYALWLLASGVLDDIWLLEGLVAASVLVLYFPLLRLYRKSSSQPPESS